MGDASADDDAEGVLVGKAEGAETPTVGVATAKAVAVGEGEPAAGAGVPPASSK